MEKNYYVKEDDFMNILLDSLDFHKEYAFNTLKDIIKADMQVVIIPFSFHGDWIPNAEAWEKSYNRINGQYYQDIITPFLSYGISENNIEFINYYKDDTNTAKSKIAKSHIIFFTGGFPEKIMERLKEFNILTTVEEYSGIIMGWSAGAMMQCENYYVSPDKDYPEFVYGTGLKRISDFTVEVHYKGTETQIESMKKYIKETGNEVYTTEKESAIIVDNGQVILLGNAKKYAYV